jgi:hypothetical protein
MRVHQLAVRIAHSQVKEQLKRSQIVQVESYFSFKPVRRSMEAEPPMPERPVIDILPHPVYLLQYF